MKIVFVGLSNKKNLKPFDKKTKSGEIIDQIIDALDDHCYKLNLVSYAPLNDDNKLRYPTKLEIIKERPKFLREIKKINPDIIIGFGNIVGNELKKIKLINNKLIIKKHPSYIYVYKRKEINNYIEDTISEINSYKVRK
ncbi:MAG: hypothetical protein PHN42_01325 [Bacilli bacterium]|nr:hypothetical protein [Bacilli bacterium]